MLVKVIQKSGVAAYLGVSKKWGVPFWGSLYKDYSILGSIFGSPYFGKLPLRSSSRNWPRSKQASNSRVCKVVLKKAFCTIPA